MELRQHAFYMSHAFGDAQGIIEDARDALKGISYDSLVGTGLSGALVVPLLGRALDKHWMIVRKDEDGSHSHRKGEGSLGARWVFVDDLIDSGRTAKRIQREVSKICEQAKHETSHVGSYLYNPMGGGDQYWFPAGKYPARWKNTPAELLDNDAPTA